MTVEPHTLAPQAGKRSDAGLGRNQGVSLREAEIERIATPTSVGAFTQHRRRYRYDKKRSALSRHFGRAAAMMEQVAHVIGL